MRLLWFALLLTVLLGLSGVSPASAQQTGQTVTWSGEYQGRALTVILVTRGHMVPENVQRGQPWWQWGNTSSDTYFFVFSDDRLVDLVLEFSTENGRSEARLYAPNTQEQRLGINIGQGTYELPAILPPTVIFWPRQGGWLVDGKLNPAIDGLERDLTSGQLMWKLSIGGKPGHPQWYTRTRIYDPAPKDGYPRFGMGIQEDMSVTYEQAEPLMPSWPYLSIGTAKDFDHYDPRLRPLQFDPFGRVINMKWVGFHTAGMYQINSLAYPPRVDFEAPFAFYRFDPSHDLYPNLVIRSDIWPADGPFGPPIADAQRTAMRMTWTGRQAGLWRYSLTVAGPHAPESTVKVGDVTVQAVPYRQLPVWVAGQVWPAVTFVEDTEGETGSEGIYDYSMEDNWDVHFWLNGLSDTPPDNYRAPYLSFKNIDPRRLNKGMRGEYSLHYDRQPRVYLSPIDNRAHLMYAQEGLWNLNGRQVLRTRNLDGGPAVDAWVRERVPASQKPQEHPRAVDGVAEEALYHLGGLLLYGGERVVELRLPDSLPPDSELPVPTDAASWDAFLNAVAPAETAQRDPRNLASWLDPLPGPALRLEGASIDGVRPVPGGMRFVLTLDSGFRVAQGSLLEHEGFAIPSLSELAPGAYVVTYDGTLHLQRLTPPRLSAEIFVTPLTSLVPGIVSVEVRNAGLEDIREATVELRAEPVGGPQAQVITETVALLAGEPTVIDLRWTPPLGGEWKLTVKVPELGGNLETLDVATANVAPSPSAAPQATWGVSVTPRLLPPLAITVAAALIAAGTVLWRSWGARVEGSHGTD